MRRIILRIDEGTVLLITFEKEQWPSTTAAIVEQERKLEIKVEWGPSSK